MHIMENDPILMILFFSVFIITGIYQLFRAFFPIRLEMHGCVAQIIKKSILPPFEYKRKIIPNVSQAIVKTHVSYERNSRGFSSSRKKISYSVALRDINGIVYSLTHKYPDEYYCECIQKEINQTIETNDVLNKIFDKNSTIDKIWGFLFVLIPLTIMLYTLNKNASSATIALVVIIALISIILPILIVISFIKDTKEIIKEVKTNNTTVNTETQQNQQQSNNPTDENNYNDINNSIIK